MLPVLANLHSIEIHLCHDIYAFFGLEPMCTVFDIFRKLHECMLGRLSDEERKTKTLRTRQKEQKMFKQVKSFVIDAWFSFSVKERSEIAALHFTLTSLKQNKVGLRIFPMIVVLLECSKPVTSKLSTWFFVPCIYCGSLLWIREDGNHSNIFSVRRYSTNCF